MRARALLALADIEYWRAGESAQPPGSPKKRCARRRPAPAGALPRGSSRCRPERAICHARRRRARRRSSFSSRTASTPIRRSSSLALSARVRADLFLGDGLDRAAAERALELERASAPPPVAVDTRIAFKLGQWLRYVDDFDGARRHLELAEHAAEDEGDESSLANILLNRTLLECWSGNWETRRRARRPHAELFAQTGRPVRVGQHLARVRRRPLGRVEAVRSRPRACPRRRAGRADALGALPRARGARRRRLRAARPPLAAAVAALRGDRLPRACDLADRRRRDRGCARRRRRRARASAARRLGGGRGALADPVEPRGRRALPRAPPGGAGRPRRRRRRARARARGARRSPVPFELARTLLVAGQVLRRLKQKRAGARAARSAPPRSSTSSARRRGRRARATSSARTATRAAPDDLTPTELRIARLAAPGSRTTRSPRGLRQPQDGRGEPRSRLPQARHQHARPARPRARRAGDAGDSVGFPRFLAPARRS